MNTQKPQDFERLSAYIDNQLSLAEKAELEARLAREPELKAGLQDLQQTVRALRSLPLVKPPRSFTLTPKQIGARARRGPLFPALRLGAALATLTLALVVAGDFASHGGLAASASRDLSTQGGAVTSVSAPNAASLPSPTSTPEAGVASLGASALVPTETAAPHNFGTPTVRMNVMAPSETPTGTDQRPLATGGPTIKNVAPSETPAAADTPVSVAALPPVATVATPATAESAAQSSAPGPSSLRLAEVLLGLLALALGAAAWRARRA